MYAERSFRVIQYTFINKVSSIKCIQSHDFNNELKELSKGQKCDHGKFNQ